MLIVAPLTLAGCDPTEAPPSAEPNLRSPAVAASREAFQATTPSGDEPPGEAPHGMVWIPGGEFSMGVAPIAGMSKVGMQATSDSRPIHRVRVAGFWMDVTEVTNAQFAAFVKATGYLTVSERTPRPEDFPGVPAERLVAGSVVFTQPDYAVLLDDHSQWWRYMPGASWRHPLGPGSSIHGKDPFPVVHTAYDAVAYAQWAKKRLPTEAEWESQRAAGSRASSSPWAHAGIQWMANTHQGYFMNRDAGQDQHPGIAAVARFAPTGYGLYDVDGNVWEWVSDWYRPDYYAQLAASGGVAVDPRGPAASFHPDGPHASKRVHRGGSFLRTDRYCATWWARAARARCARAPTI